MSCDILEITVALHTGFMVANHPPALPFPVLEQGPRLLATTCRAGRDAIGPPDRLELGVRLILGQRPYFFRRQARGQRGEKELLRHGI